LLNINYLAWERLSSRESEFLIAAGPALKAAGCMQKQKPLPPSISHLKKRILVQDQGGAEFQPAGILKYVEDLKRGTNAEVGPKDFFEIAYNNRLIPYNLSSIIFTRLFDRPSPPRGADIAAIDKMHLIQARLVIRQKIAIF
jgi:hypothetical protein